MTHDLHVESSLNKNTALQFGSTGLFGPEEIEWQPLRGNIIIELPIEDAMTKGGIHIPEAARQSKRQGKVVVVGLPRVLDDGKTLDVQCSVGDVVTYREGTITPLKERGCEYGVIDERYVLARIPQAT